MLLKDILHPEKKIAILWFWKEGQSTLEFLLKQGKKDITILDFDARKADYMYHYTKKYNQILYYEFWEKYLDNLKKFDYIIKTPWISPFQEKIIKYKEKCISQTQIFFSKYHEKVIGITGTKGKSTVSTLLTTSLEKLWYKVKLVWNIWNPVLDEIDIFWNDVYDFIIYELSSYMLQDFSPSLYIGIINNIYPCHLDWHNNSYDIYQQSKINILKNTSIKIINYELEDNEDIKNINGNIYFFWKQGRSCVKNTWIYVDNTMLIELANTKLIWIHNLYNIAAVCETILHINNNTKHVLSTLKEILHNFSWLPHRLQDIWIYEGIRFIDDAIATTPESTIAAIKALNWWLQSILLWWQDSWFSFEKIRKEILHSSIDIVIAFPDTSEKIFPEILYRPYDMAFEMMIDGKNILFLKTRSMKIAINFCFRNTLYGRSVLLSSWAPSFSLWRNYTDKAKEFIFEVQNF